MLLYPSKCCSNLQHFGAVAAIFYSNSLTCCHNCQHVVASTCCYVRQRVSVIDNVLLHSLVCCRLLLYPLKCCRNYQHVAVSYNMLLSPTKCCCLLQHVATCHYQQHVAVSYNMLLSPSICCNLPLSSTYCWIFKHFPDISNTLKSTGHALWFHHASFNICILPVVGLYAALDTTLHFQIFNI